LYFEELLDGIKCEILKPFFIEDSPKVNMKDYIEVNSAISLALQGLEYGLANMNFNKKNTWNQLKEALGSDITFGGKKGKDNGKKKININLNSPKVKQWVMRDFFRSISTISCLWRACNVYRLWNARKRKRN